MRRPLLVVALAALVGMAAGCAEDEPTIDIGEPATTAPTTTPRSFPAGGECPDGQGAETRAEDQMLDGTLEVRFDEPLRSGEPVTWTLVMRSDEADPVTLVFRSGQDGDVELEQDGTVAYRWSEDMFFTQALRCRTITPGETLTFELQQTTLDVPPGDYTLRATLAAEPAPGPVERQVTVQP